MDHHHSASAGGDMSSEKLMLRDILEDFTDIVASYLKKMPDEEIRQIFIESLQETLEELKNDGAHQ